LLNTARPSRHRHRETSLADQGLSAPDIVLLGSAAAGRPLAHQAPAFRCHSQTTAQREAVGKSREYRMSSRAGTWRSLPCSRRCASRSSRPAALAGLRAEFSPGHPDRWDRLGMSRTWSCSSRDEVACEGGVVADPGPTSRLRAPRGRRRLVRGGSADCLDSAGPKVWKGVR